ncbi:glycosyltransferase family 2 protein [Longispora albida]|uniref:glycosyltransferase family 2 protein n=1 Tax=Longispora albida TaxID=203523 RepID=UPI00039EFA8D|nr:glycosyltransferase family 2 protein [Longispora albida]
MTRALLILSIAIPAFVLVSVIAAIAYGWLRPDKVRQREAAPAAPRFEPVELSNTAVLIACRNGEATIADAVAAAKANGVEVYVVSDASTDGTAARATAAGAHVLALTENVGKPEALKIAYQRFGLSWLYDAVTILDDDVTIEPGFVAEALALLDDDVAIVVGKNVTLWPEARRWNVWLAKRAYSYWNYQVIVRRLQSAFNVMNCISGSNSMYRTTLLDEVLPVAPPYIVDDTYWVLETHRRGLGKVVYAPRAVAWLQDPTTLRDWYKQNLRWLWGTFQGIIGHRVGRQASRFDFAYVLLMFHWLLYVLNGPLTVWLVASAGLGFGRALAWLAAGQLIWLSIAAWRLRLPRLVLFLPAIVVLDLLYRVIMVHALVKAIRQPTVERCVWTSPPRLSLEGR